MRSRPTSPVDTTPPTGPRRAVLVIGASFTLAFACNPGSLGRWGYMLDDNAITRPVQVATEAVADGAVGAWKSAGLRVPYDALREWSRRVRQAAGASD